MMILLYVYIEIDILKNIIHAFLKTWDYIPPVTSISLFEFRFSEHVTRTKKVFLIWTSMSLYIHT